MNILALVIHKLQPEQRDTQTDTQIHEQTHRQADKHTGTQIDLTEIITYPHARMVMALVDYDSDGMNANAKLSFFKAKGTVKNMFSFKRSICYHYYLFFLIY